MKWNVHVRWFCSSSGCRFSIILRTPSPPLQSPFLSALASAFRRKSASLRIIAAVHLSCSPPILMLAPPLAAQQYVRHRTPVRLPTRIRFVQKVPIISFLRLIRLMYWIACDQIRFCVIFISMEWPSCPKMKIILAPAFSSACASGPFTHNTIDKNVNYPFEFLVAWKLIVPNILFVYFVIRKFSRSADAYVIRHNS